MILPTVARPMPCPANSAFPARWKGTNSFSGHLLDRLAVAVDNGQRFAQVVGNRVIERLKLPVGGCQFDVQLILKYIR